MPTEYFPLAPGVLINVSKARKLCRQRKANAVYSTLDAERIVELGEVRVCKKHVRQGKLKKEPVLLIEVAGRAVLVDGWHRAMRARQQGGYYISAILLTVEEAKRVAVRSKKLK